MIEIKNFSKSYDNGVLIKYSNMSISYGFYKLEGKNGSGKSTLLNCLSKFDEQFDGEILINGLSILKIDKHNYYKDYVSILTQSIGSQLSISVVKFFDISKNKDIDYEQLITDFNLPKNILKKNLNSLSQGMLQKVKLISIILKDNPIIILDEPNNNVDIDLGKLLEKYCSQKVVLVTSHSQMNLNLNSLFIDKENLVLGNQNIFITQKPEKKLKFNVLNKSTLLIKILICVTLIITSMLLCLTVFSNRDIIRNVFDFTNKTGFSEDSLIISSPVSSEKFMVYGNSTWNENIPYFFSSEHLKMLQDNPLIKSIVPLQTEGHYMSSTWYLDKYHIGHDQITNNIYYAPLQVTYEVASNVAAFKIPNARISNLLVGDYAQNENEVIISTTFADELLNIYGFTEYEQLFKATDFKIREIERGIDNFNYGTTPIENKTFKITGIYESNSENGYTMYGIHDQNDSSNLTNEFFNNTADTQQANLDAVSLLNSIYSTKDIAPIDESTIDDNFYIQYPQFYIQTTSPDNLKKLEKQIHKFDKYIEITSNNSNDSKNVFQFMKRDLLKASLSILFTVISSLAIILFLSKLYLRKIKNDCNLIHQLGYSKLEIKKQITKEIYEFIFISFNTCIIGTFLIYSAYFRVTVILLLLLINALLLLIYIIYLKRIKYENLLSNDKA